MTEPDLILLHGAGQSSDAWRGVIAGLPEHVTPHALEYGSGSTFTLSTAAARVLNYLDTRRLEHVVLCGLSLGGIVAALVAAKRPEQVTALLLSGIQVRPNRFLMHLQNTVIRALPTHAVERAGGRPKRELLHILDVAAGTDLAPVLPSISAPALVLCGTKDRPNLPAAHQAAELLPNSRLELIPGVGHAWNTSHPALFAERITRFVYPG